MKLTNWLRSYFFDADTVEDWTPSRVQKLERETLESAGVDGFHFEWSRTIAVEHQRTRQRDAA